MTRAVLVFWSAAVAVTGGIAILSAFLFPFASLGIETIAERQRVWLLTLWTGGVLGILFGSSAILGTFGGVGVREVLEAGSLTEAVKMQRRARTRWNSAQFHHSFGWWLVSVGVLLIAVYFAAWSIL